MKKQISYLISFVLIIMILFVTCGKKATEPELPEDNKQQTTSYLLSDSLVAYYPFNGNAVDESDNNHHGEVVGAILIPDRFGNLNSAYFFDGVDDHIIANDSCYPKNSEARTITVWFKTTAMGFLINYGTGTVDYQETYLNVENNIVSAGTGGDNCHTYGSSIVNDGKWHFVAAVYDETLWKIYADGIDESSYEGGTSPITNTVLTGITTIGCATTHNVGGMHSYFNGTIDGVRIYNRVLTASEIQTLYTEGGWTGN
jgi:hypothetical protein